MFEHVKQVLFCKIYTIQLYKKGSYRERKKLSMFTSIFVPILTYGHESWVINEKVRSLIQASKTFAKKSKALRCLANNAIRESQHRVATSPDRKIENGLDV